MVKRNTLGLRDQAMMIKEIEGNAKKYSLLTVKQAADELSATFAIDVTDKNAQHIADSIDFEFFTPGKAAPMETAMLEKAIVDLRDTVHGINQRLKALEENIPDIHSPAHG